MDLRVSALLILGMAYGASAVAVDLSSFGRGIAKEIVSVKRPVVQTVATIGSSQCSNAKKLFGLDYQQLEGVKEPDLNQLSLKYVTPLLNVSFNINAVSDVLLQLGRSREEGGLGGSHKLVIYIHGFTDDPGKGSFGNISEAFIKKGNYSILALDGSSLIRWLYLRATTYVRFMGEKLGAILAKTIEAGFDPSNLHIVGHSLGAHIAGFTGKQVAKVTGRHVGRVTGLDPAGPCFSFEDPELRLHASDAEFVDVIHTDGGVYGMTDPVGQVDYFPNNGVDQPNCLLDTCSHSRAWRYFAESVLREGAFPARRCNSWDAFKKGACDEDISYMGFPSKPGTKGLYYLQTGEDSPFGLEMKGISYNNNEGYVKKIIQIAT